MACAWASDLLKFLKKMRTTPAPSRGKKGKQELLKMQGAVGKKKGITPGPYPRNNPAATKAEKYRVCDYRTGVGGTDSSVLVLSRIALHGLARRSACWREALLRARYYFRLWRNEELATHHLPGRNRWLRHHLCLDRASVSILR